LMLWDENQNTDDDIDDKKSKKKAKKKRQAKRQKKEDKNKVSNKEKAIKEQLIKEDNDIIVEEVIIDEAR